MGGRSTIPRPSARERYPREAAPAGQHGLLVFGRNSEGFAALAAASSDNALAPDRLGAGEESVGLRALTLFWLVGSFWHRQKLYTG